MTAYVLETGIVIPAKRGGGKPRSEERKLMETMDVGQSFLIDDYNRFMFVRGIAARFRPRKFSVRKSEGGWRVWRVA